MRDGDGYLDFGPSRTRPTDFHKANPQEGYPRLRLRRFGPDEDIELPISILEVEGNCTRYFAFKKAYFLFDCMPMRDTGKETRFHFDRFNCLPAWWLWRDGRTEKMCIPSGPWNSGASFSVIPTARGVFISTVRDGGHVKPKHAGGYLVRDGQIEKVVSGIVLGAVVTERKTSVSTDGCRVAFSHVPNFDAIDNRRPGPFTVRILDVCVDGDNKPEASKGG